MLLPLLESFGYNASDFSSRDRRASQIGSSDCVAVPPSMGFRLDISHTGDVLFRSISNASHRLSIKRTNILIFRKKLKISNSLDDAISILIRLVFDRPQDKAIAIRIRSVDLKTSKKTTFKCCGNKIRISQRKNLSSSTRLFAV